MMRYIFHSGAGILDFLVDSVGPPCCAIVGVEASFVAIAMMPVIGQG
jgi:hypothetical protein